VSYGSNKVALFTDQPLSNEWSDSGSAVLNDSNNLWDCCLQEVKPRPAESDQQCI
jgi:hypothetical protein